MGYNLYITRRKGWADEDGPGISIDEWRSYVDSDAELRMDDSLGEHVAVWSGPSNEAESWLAWTAGNLETKNPDEPLVRKMIAVAGALGAKVQGDDGERYDQPGSGEPVPLPGLLERMKGLWSRLTARPLTPMDPSQLPFKVGDRIRDVFSQEATVTGIDVRAEHGAGVITVRYDDGRLVHSAAFAHGFERTPATLTAADGYHAPDFRAPVLGKDHLRNGPGGKYWRRTVLARSMAHYGIWPVLD